MGALGDRQVSAKIVLLPGDITREPADAIVNAANTSLMGGGGVDGAIHRAGGPSILQECVRIRETEWPHGMPRGRVAVTTAGKLPARYVFHTVGPVHSQDAHFDLEADRGVLAACFRNCLRAADYLGCRIVTFPAISTGAYGWPLDDAARIAVSTITAAPTFVREARFVFARLDTLDAFTSALARSRAERPSQRPYSRYVR